VHEEIEKENRVSFKERQPSEAGGREQESSIFSKVSRTIRVGK
jgi:hypothetical protein